MTIKEIFEAFDNIGFLTFATIDGNYPATRIAHFFAYDNEGLYFRTMNTKPFYAQLNTYKTVSVCGLYEEEEDAETQAQSISGITGSYSIRVTGDVKTISPDALTSKAKKNSLFQSGVDDMQRYRTMRTFVLYKGFGEVFNFDFTAEASEQTLNRIFFSFNDARHPLRGLKINPEKCTKCGACLEVCTFKAIQKKAGSYTILNNRCDACGDCSVACKSGAIDIVAD